MATLGEDIVALTKVYKNARQRPLLRKVFRNTRQLRALDEFFEEHPQVLPDHAKYVRALVQDIDTLRNASTLKETREYAETFKHDIEPIQHLFCSLANQEAYFDLKRIALRALADGYLAELED